jgi:hypothetical protein
MTKRFGASEASTLRIVPFLAISTLVLGQAAAECGTTSDPEVTLDTLVAGTYYIDADICSGPACIGSVWVYQESNGKPGLQRGDEVHDDTCGGLTQADTIIF